MAVPIVSPLDKAQYAHRSEANKILTHVLLSGKYQPGPVEVLPNGLDGVNAYLDRARKGAVSSKYFSRILLLKISHLFVQVRGVKLVSRVAETPQIKNE